jgi:hypothetical protein
VAGKHPLKAELDQLDEEIQRKTERKSTACKRVIIRMPAGGTGYSDIWLLLDITMIRLDRYSNYAKW